MLGSALRAATRPRSFVSVIGPSAAAFLQSMVSNDVDALGAGDSCEALLLTPKARIIAPLVVLRRGVDDFLLLSEPELGERLRSELLRFRFAAKCAIELEEHRSTLVLGSREGGIPSREFGVPAVELIDGEPPPGVEPVTEDELERLRILARAPRWGLELDDRVLPAEAGLDETAISFTKGCYPGQEPVARLHYRGHPNRGLRVLRVEGETLPGYDAELVLEGKAVGRVTSAARDDEHGIVALAYVRREVPADAALELDGRQASQL